MKPTLLALTAFALLHSGCDKPVATPKAITLSTFPLAVGNMWVYDNSDTVRVVADTTINGVDARKVVTSNSAASFVAYYSCTADGLYLLGGNSSVHTFEGATGNFPDTMQFFFTPLKLTSFPSVVGKSWLSDDYYTASRKWTGFVTVTTAAGTFDCISMSSTGGITEFYSAKGLVATQEDVECFAAPCPSLKATLIYVNF